MKNVNRVLMTLQAYEQGATTVQIAEELQMDRTLVSRLLNQLVEQGTIIKSANRPVLYQYRQEGEKTSTTVFDQMIGAHDSLRFAIEQCKSAVKYPNGGLTILLTGHSGVGKSFLASSIFAYAKSEHMLAADAKFVVFNCADYASNAELLSSKLFGYKKGAFTGAEEDHEGIIAQADGGYLFLDEVHRLSPEGQEKLFLLLDQGVYQKLGDKTYHKVDVRLICATTEDPNRVLIDTFLRRIPITVNLPELAKRNIKERLDFIRFFYARESRTFYRPIHISKKVINYLLTCSLPGNIGELMNIIKVTCANASRRADASQDEIYVDERDLSLDLGANTHVQEYFQDDKLNVNGLEGEAEQKSSITPAKMKDVLDMINEIHEELKRLIKQQLDEEEVLKQIRVDSNRISDILYYHNHYFNHSLYGSLFCTHVEKGLRLLEQTYGIRYYGNTVKIISEVLLSLHEPIFQQEEHQQLFASTYQLIKTRNFKYHIMASRLVQYLHDSFGYVCNMAEELYIALYIFTMNTNQSHNDINVVILAHGYSTASSIASVVNQMHSNYIVEAFDMPIDMEPKDIVVEIRNYAKNLNKEKDTIFLVDMGSLFDIYSLVKDCFDGSVVVINNISTHLALAVGNMVNQGKSIIDIIDSVTQNLEIQYKYYERKGKKKAIVTTCATGIGTAYKMRDMIKSCIMHEQQHVEVVTCDYFSLKNMGRNSEIFNKYDVQLIITTLGLSIPDVPTMLFSELFSPENEGKIRSVFQHLYDEESIEQIINNLMKMLTLENVISRLIILNPTKVIDNVEHILRRIEERFVLQLDSNLKLSLYIHIAIMVERCVLTKKDDLDLIHYHTDQTKRKMLREIFDECLTDFQVEIPDQELDIIIRLIEEYDTEHKEQPGEDE